MGARPAENGSACRSERSNWFLVLYVPLFKTLWQYSERTSELELIGIWEIAHIARTVPDSTLRGRIEVCVTPS